MLSGCELGSGASAVRMSLSPHQFTKVEANPQVPKSFRTDSSPPLASSMLPFETLVSF